MDSQQKRQKKVSQILRYFLADDDYSFTDVLSTPDDVGFGYYIQLTSTSIDYQTYLSNEYLDAHKIDDIIMAITLSLRKLNTYGDD